MIIVNFKTYPQTNGENALKMAQICSEAAKQSGVKIIIGVQATDIYRITSQIDIPVFSQHLDPIEPEKNTGFISALALKKAGAVGVFLNHSEHPFSDFNTLEKSHQLAKKEGLETLIFVPQIETAIRVDQFHPDYIALEEPSLVGKEAMIHFPKFKQIITDFCQKIKSFPLLGAGIKTHKDVAESLKLGIKGIVFSSQFVNSSYPKQLLLSFTSCFL